jgi:hypothetical protein
MLRIAVPGVSVALVLRYIVGHKRWSWDDPASVSQQEWDRVIPEATKLVRFVPPTDQNREILRDIAKRTGRSPPSFGTNIFCRVANSTSSSSCCNYSGRGAWWSRWWFIRNYKEIANYSSPNIYWKQLLESYFSTGMHCCRNLLTKRLRTYIYMYASACLCGTRCLIFKVY